MNSVRLYSRMTTLLCVISLLSFGLALQAQVLPPNDSVNGTLNAATPQIDYAFTVPSDGDATFTITPTGNLYANIQFLDQDGTFRLESPLEGNGNPSTFTVTHLNAGATYFVRAIRRNSNSGDFTLSNVFTPQAISNDTEPNDGTATALSVAMPATRTGHLGYSRTNYNDRDGEDWYKFTVPSDGDLTLTLTPTTTLYANIQFHDQDGTFRLESPLEGTGNPSTFTITHLNPGANYYLKILNRNAGYGGYTLTSSFVATSFASDAEPNDGPATALSVAMPATRRGHLGYSRTSYNDRDNEDWYKFTVSSDGNLNLTITPTTTLYANIQFYDSNATFLFESPLNGVGVAGSFTIAHLNPGTTYYLRIFNRNAGYGSYTIASTFNAATLTNDGEVNDTSASAIPVAMPVNRTGHLGYSRATYNDRDNEDWYKFTVPADGNLLLTVTPTSTLYVNIQFYDSDGATFRLESPLNGAGVASTFTIAHLNPGTNYYLRIYNRSTGYGSYSLTSTFLPTDLTNDAELNDGSASALSVEMPDTRTGHLGYSRASYPDRDNEDWYKFTVPTDGDLTLTVTPTSTLYVNIQFYDSDGATFRFESPLNGTGNDSTFTIPHLGPGTTYYLRIFNRSAGYGSYELQGRFRAQNVVNDPENNDGPGSAISITTFTGKTGHLGYSRDAYNTLDEEDWYTFSHPGGEIDVTVVNTGSLYSNLQLYASNGTTFLTESPLNGAGNPSRLLTTRAAGTYFLRVLRRGGHGAYGLNPQDTISIGGNIVLEDCVETPQPVVVEVRPEEGAPMVFNVSDGEFLLSGLPRQRYDVSFKGAKWLRRTEGVDANVGNIFIVNAFLRAGDANNDNAVDILDLDVLIQTFDLCAGDGGFDTRGDLNCDGCADVLDLDLLIRNFDKFGDE